MPATPLQSTVEVTHHHIAERQEFFTEPRRPDGWSHKVSSMSGVRYPAKQFYSDYDKYLFGMLPMHWIERLCSKPVVYIVFSYATPIAWVHEDGEAVLPNVSYSSTTAKHQYQARRGLVLGYGVTDSRPETQAAVLAEAEARNERAAARKAKRTCAAGHVHPNIADRKHCDAECVQCYERTVKAKGGTGYLHAHSGEQACGLGDGSTAYPRSVWVDRNLRTKEQSR